jgi:hypothetical protein
MADIEHAHKGILNEHKRKQQEMLSLCEDMKRMKSETTVKGLQAQVSQLQTLVAFLFDIQKDPVDKQDSFLRIEGNNIVNERTLEPLVQKIVKALEEKTNG